MFLDVQQSSLSHWITKGMPFPFRLGDNLHVFQGLRTRTRQGDNTVDFSRWYRDNVPSDSAPPGPPLLSGWHGRARGLLHRLEISGASVVAKLRNMRRRQLSNDENDPAYKHYHLIVLAGWTHAEVHSSRGLSADKHVLWIRMPVSTRGGPGPHLFSVYSAACQQSSFRSNLRPQIDSVKRPSQTVLNSSPLCWSLSWYWLWKFAQTKS